MTLTIYSTPYKHLVITWPMARTLGNNKWATPVELEGQWDSFQNRLELLTLSYV